MRELSGIWPQKLFSFRNLEKGICLGLFLSLVSWVGNAQTIGGIQNIRAESQGRGGSDSLRLVHRKDIHIHIYYHFLNSIQQHPLDSSINNFYAYYPLPVDYATLGNLGNPGYAMIFHPSMDPGWDPGFHSLQEYSFRLKDSRFFNTSGPFTELRYLVGPKQQQVIDVFHTQNRKDNFNIGGHYRKINSPGFFRNQLTNDDSYNLFARYNTHNRHFHTYVSLVGNNLNTGENGGILNDSDLYSPLHGDRQTIATNLGGNNANSNYSFFSSSIPVKSSFRHNGVLWANRYDWGRGDSLWINDSVKRYVFYPVLRVQETLQYSHTIANYRDTLTVSDSTDAAFYSQNYQVSQPDSSTATASNQWNYFSNDLSLEQFPVPSNQAQFIRAGIRLEQIHGIFPGKELRLNNLLGHFEYRNKTKNQKWDMDLLGTLYLAGDYFGNYQVFATLSRFLSPKLGQITLSFHNVDRTPDYIYRYFYSNLFQVVNNTLKYENTTQFQFRLDNPALHSHLSVNYFLMANYTYFRNYYQSAQYSSPFTILQVMLNKQFRLNHFNWYMDLAFQQATGSPPLHMPTVWTWDRFTYENSFFNSNLELSTGIGLRYYSNYYGDDYSPVLQHFVYQDSYLIHNKPELDAFFNFQIRTFTAYIRGDQLNKLLYPNIFGAPHYPYGDIGIQIGVKWDFFD